MRTTILLLLCALLALAQQAHAGPYIDDVAGPDDGMMDDYGDSNLEHLLQSAPQKRSSLIYLFRRACVRRGGNCDHRPKDCCYNSSCRCNLWGANCRCQRMGLFQKWGKK